MNPNRREYLLEILTTLYPPPHRLRLRSAASYPDHRPVASYRILPLPQRPQLLVPALPARATARILRYTVCPTSRLARLARAVAITGLTLPGATRLALPGRIDICGPPEADSFPRYLRHRLGRPVALAVHIGGPVRANRKPVVALLGDEGKPIGYAKLGVTPLTHQLINNERDALRILGTAQLRHVTVPQILHSGQWRGHNVLVQSALPVWRPRPLRSSAAIARAMVEVATVHGHHTGPLTGSGYAEALLTRLSALPADPDVTQLTHLTRRLLAHGHRTVLTYGAWHGDWTPWNTHPLPDGVLVWDWERFSLGVPLGLDAFHLFLAVRVSAGADLAQTVRECLARAPKLLAPFSVPPAAARLTCLLYLVDIGIRHLTDRALTGHSRHGEISAWLLPVLRCALNAEEEFV